MRAHLKQLAELYLASIGAVTVAAGIVAQAATMLTVFGEILGWWDLL